MSVNKTIKLNWQGKTYPLMLTMGMIDQIDEQINIMTMVRRCSTGDIRFSHAAKFFAILLNLAGAKEVTQQDVFDALFTDDEHGPVELVNAINEILFAMFPQTKKKSGKPTRKKK